VTEHQNYKFFQSQSHPNIQIFILQATSFGLGFELSPGIIQ